jgi:hypothetical protein
MRAVVARRFFQDGVMRTSSASAGIISAGRLIHGRRAPYGQRADTLNEARALAAKMASGSSPPLLVVELDFRQQTEKVVVDPDCIVIETHRILNMRERVFEM